MRYDMALPTGARVGFFLLVATSATSAITVMGACAPDHADDGAGYPAATSSSELEGSASSPSPSPSPANPLSPPLDPSAPLANDQPALQAAIDAAIRTGTPLDLRPGDHRLDCGQATFCLRIANAVHANGLTLRGHDTRLRIVSPRSGGIEIVRSRQVRIEGITIDWAVVPWTQGRVERVDDATGTFDYRADLTDGAGARFAQPTDDAIAVDALQSPLRPHVVAQIFHDGDPTPVDIALVQGSKITAEGNLWRVRVAGPPVSTRIHPGADRFVVGNRSKGALRIVQSENVAVIDTRVLSAPGAAVSAVDNRGSLLFDGFRILKPAGRVYSSLADGFHVQNDRIGLTIRHGVFQGMGDDAINTYALGFRLGQVLGPREVVVQPDGPGLAFPPLLEGDQIQVLDPALRVDRLAATAGPSGIGAARIDAAVASHGGVAGRTRLTLDRDLPAALQDWVFHVQAATPYFVMENNSFFAFRGGFRIRSGSAQVRDNWFELPINARILHSVDTAGAAFFHEGPMAPPPLLTNNRVKGGGAIDLFGFCAPPGCESWSWPPQR